MQKDNKIVTSFFLLLMFAHVVNAKIGSTPTGRNAMEIRDTMYFCSADNLRYDTIPYMLYDKYFMEALDELSKLYITNTD